jgi:lipoprotein-anchoring transpeptidase ErfK/SrfK
MLKHSLAAISLLTISLFSNPKVLLAKEKPVTINHKIPSNLNSQLTRLELSLSRRKVTLYRANIRLKTYPVAVGRAGWETPKGNFKVIQMRQNPKWINPLTGEAILGGDPENPLGRRWIGFWTNGRNWVGFHGTPNPSSVGQAVSHGCVRMHNKDIEELFTKVSPGTPIKVVL